jgi:hypothetical protein
MGLDRVQAVQQAVGNAVKALDAAMEQTGQKTTAQIGAEESRAMIANLCFCIPTACAAAACTASTLLCTHTPMFCAHVLDGEVRINANHLWEMYGQHTFGVVVLSVSARICARCESHR